MSDLLLRGKVDMSDVQKGMASGAESVKKYEQQIESAAASTGRFEKTIQQQMKELKKLLTHLENTGRAGTQEFKNAQKALADLTDQMGDMQETARMMASDTVNFDIANKSLTGLVSAMAALQGVTALTGSESTKLASIMKSLQAVIGAVTAAAALANLMQKQFIATMMANPIGLALTAIAGIAAGIMSVVQSNKNAAEQMKKDQEEAARKAEEAWQKTCDNIKKQLDSISRKTSNGLSYWNYDQFKKDASNTERITKLRDPNATPYSEEIRRRQEAIRKEFDKHNSDWQYSKEGQKLTKEFYDNEIGYVTALYNETGVLTKDMQEMWGNVQKERIEYNKDLKAYQTRVSVSSSSKKTEIAPEFGSEEWMKQGKKETEEEWQKRINKYWDFEFARIQQQVREEAANKPIRVPIIVEEEEVEEEFWVYKLMEDMQREFQNGMLQDQMDYYEKLYNNENLSNERRLEAYRNYVDAKSELAEKERDIMVSAISSVGSALSSLGDATDSNFLSAAGIIGQAIASLLQGYAIASAQAAKFGPIAWAAFSAAGLAQVAGMIAQVKQLGAYADGGIIGGMTSVGDYNIARVNKGEMILNGTQQKHLFDMLNGKGAASENTNNSNVTFRIQGSELVGVLDNYQHKRSKVR